MRSSITDMPTGPSSLNLHKVPSFPFNSARYIDTFDFSSSIFMPLSMVPSPTENSNSQMTGSISRLRVKNRPRKGRSSNH